MTILLLTGGMGGGHTSPMEGIEHELDKFNSRDVRLVVHKDIEVAPFKRNRKDHIRYVTSNNRLGVKIATKYREKVSQKETYARVAEIVAQAGPVDLVLTNHRIINQAVAKHLPENIPVALVTADHGKIHDGWIARRMRNPNTMDVLYVPGETGFEHAMRCGVPRGQIKVFGYPVREPFERHRNSDPALMRTEMNLPQDVRVVVMSGAGKNNWGGKFINRVKSMVAHESFKDIHLVVIAGRNEELHEELRAISAAIDVRGFQEAEDMARLVRATADDGVNVIKGGGGAVGESYVLRVVSLVAHIESGVEHGNRDHIEQENTGIVALSEKKFLSGIFDTTRSQLEVMRENQDKLKTVGAAADIAKDVRVQALESAARAAATVAEMG